MHEPTPPAELAVREILAAFRDLHVVVGAVADDPEAVWIADPGRPLRITVMPAPTTAEVRELVAELPVAGLLVADRLAGPQRAVLEAAGWGWWDRRGAVRVASRSGVIELEPPAVPALATEVPTPFARVAGRTVGVHLLRSPEVARSVRDIAAETGLSVGAVGRTVAELRQVGLVDDDNLPAVPGLFEELARWWRPRWYGVAADVAQQRPAELAAVLRVGDDPRDARGHGWAVVSRHALPSYGQDEPPGETPLRLLVTDARALAWAVQQWGVAGDADVELAAPPTPAALLARHPWGGATGPVRWRLADPLVLALTLAGSQDEVDRAAVRGWVSIPGIPDGRVW